MAKVYRVRPNVIAQLIFKAKKNHAFLDELINKEEKATGKMKAISKVVEDLNK